ncbi:Protein of unknown function [Evansella caseinilytica]|uniref:DUF2777 family protein n=1 Tax=Evansella caseinilytica TaxID=1503961 RepID=A0A1H3NL31_9BACI|nr:DUF2777 family protein [Evansella caseinilytica]SDY89135.1 Protein of unknown function [Evansella caseinilytica]
MDRKTAKKHIGKEIILDKGSHGQYVGILEEMITEPKKPWRASVRIIGVFEYPDIHLEDLELFIPYLKENELVECPGHRIEPYEGTFQHTYDESIAVSLKERWEEIQEINQNTELLLSLIQQELRRLHSEHLIFEDGYVYYQLVKKGRKIEIYDEEKREALAIAGCPFEFEIVVDDKWVSAVYIKDLMFELKNGRIVELAHGASVRLNKNQFDPYRILLNELEPPSLQALEKGLQKLGIGHRHCVYCHNSLLIQLLHSFNDQQFSGVNFVSYANSKHQFIVQHHYERNANGAGMTFDRFEFTSDSGERVLTTYATQMSQD